MPNQKDERLSPTMLLVEAHHVEGLVFKPTTPPVVKTMTRKQAEAVVHPLLERLPSGGWRNDEVHQRLAATVTKQMIMVLAPEIRAALGEWSKKRDQPTILRWTEESASLNIQQVEWTETPAGGVLEDMMKLSDDPNLGHAASRQKLQSLIRLIKLHFDQKETKQLEWVREDAYDSSGGVRKIARQLFQQVKAEVRQEVKNGVMKLVVGGPERKAAES
ncbi:hypothetical protein BBK36DRAFT_22729 [Trichoderma citrinoviride]|uniref:Uncharacterized protein n=1 Tax=Trichoderma citrinoviride TaxID=58853 RepID=A0A2T4B2B0_9HYPO|nr:hypothetical protein BBK36DRAFT_22729 [Trichoderma citrinoviride]PTB63465.1 hypothetical protein BBK36DRAFT_22729 [Trichoderma citrinoviride]